MLWKKWVRKRLPSARRWKVSLFQAVLTSLLTPSLRGLRFVTSDFRARINLLTINEAKRQFYAAPRYSISYEPPALSGSIGDCDAWSSILCIYA